jgi:hypothetical protein
MIAENVQRLLRDLPPGVELVAAAKIRTAPEILEAINAGIKIVGENYVQEAAQVWAVIGRKAQWHFIGHLQRNKVQKAVTIFDMIETVDSFELAREIDRKCEPIDKIMPVLIEINSGRESQKFGVRSEDAPQLIEQISGLAQLRVMGLMTMGPRSGNPQEARPYFIETRKIFEAIKTLNLPGVVMKYLSMGMTNSYQVALEEGANMVRIGTLIFGERNKEL